MESTVNGTGPVIAVIGAGPAGFYAAEALLEALPQAHVHMIERNAAPHGLVRYGVAPDHQKLKQVAAVFETIAGHARVRLHAGVDVGREVSLDEIRQRCHAVLLSTGAPSSRALGVPGESLPQVLGSDVFVGWYNGHPDHVGAAPDLAVGTAVVVGNGNVALDVCRLMVRAYADLAASDIPEPMLAVFARRRIREVHLLGRGGPGALKFSYKEFRQLAELPNLRIRMPQAARFAEGWWNDASSPDASRVLQWLRAATREPAGEDSGLGDSEKIVLNLWFNVAPLRFLGDRRLQGVQLREAGSAAPLTVSCEIAVSCVGFTGRQIDPAVGLAPAGTVRHRAGQVIDREGSEVPGLFVAGWAKRGPTGIIGTNRACGYESAATLVAALPALMRDAMPLAGELEALFRQRQVVTLDHAAWRLLDQQERDLGAAIGKPREKHLSMQEALRTLARQGVLA